jgi:hypothetical protein
MGTWSEDNFGNDDAGYWIYSLEKSKGIGTLMSAIKLVNSSSDYLEAPDCSEALAASEVIAAALTEDFSQVPEKAKNWVSKKRGIFGKKPNIELEHAVEAIKAVQKILKDSELKELWEESEGYSNWEKIQSTLIGKLTNV